MLESPSTICRLGYDHHLPAAPSPPSPPSRQPSFSPPSLFLNRPSALACWENYFTPSCRPPSFSSAVFLPNAAATTAAARPSSTTIHHLLLLLSPHNLTHSLLPLSLSLPLSLPAGVLILGRVSTTPPLQQQPRSTSRCPLGSSCSLSCRAVYTSRTSSRMPFRTRDEQLAARYFLFPPPPPCSCCALLLSFLSLHITCTRPAFEMI